jgi:hypothetical protein
LFRHRFAACPLVLLLAVLPACGGGGSSRVSGPTQTAPAAPPPTTLPPAPVFRNGWTEEGLSAQINPATPSASARVSVTAPGFLVREQAYDGTPIFLWPGDLAYVTELAYHEFTDGSLRTARWAGPFTITLEGDLADDPVLVAKAQEVAAEISRVSGVPVRVGPGGACLITLDPSILDEDAIAQAEWSARGATITSGRIKFARRSEIAGGSRADWPNTFLHEMGHIMGLGHSPSDRDVMTPGAGPGTKEGQFQPNEAAALHMIYAHRAPGNHLPDRDPAVSAASSAQLRRTVIVN